MNRFYVWAQFGLIIAFGAAVFLDPALLMQPEPAVAWMGLAICLVGLAIIAWALRTMGKVMQVSPEPKAEGHLITGGVYRWLRHPMYTGMTLIVIGLAMRRPTPFTLLFGVALIVMLHFKSRYEERMLVVRYADYAAYRKGTWGILLP
jgi:protein-S-isoprenylcysteine O-methyltransferase Ste14